jgi:hypothetical protein
MRSSKPACLDSVPENEVRRALRALKVSKDFPDLWGLRELQGLKDRRVRLVLWAPPVLKGQRVPSVRQVLKDRWVRKVPQGL